MKRRQLRIGQTRAGAFDFLNVKVGKYTITVEANGFSKVSTSDVNVAVNARQRVDFTLQVGAVTESITVTGEASIVDPDGRVVSDAQWNANIDRWLPSESDRAFVASLMGRVVEPGKFANWIAPPPRGINNLPIDFEYIRFN